ncbi:MAG: hypothetical protein JW747_02985 [Candidatus Aminicenantes bacterium]|nr:hypothetical protein [Candidatus Aminicenantes bacterium]
MKKALISIGLLLGVLGSPLFGQDWGSGVAAPEPGRLMFTAACESLSQAFDCEGIEERLRRRELRARVDFRPGDVLSVYGFLGSADFKGSLDSFNSPVYGGGFRLLFLGEVVVEEKDARPLEVKLGAALDFRASRFKPDVDGPGSSAGLTQFQVGLDLGLSVMGIGGYLGLAFTRNQGELPYAGVLNAVPASGLNFSSALGLHYKFSRHLGLAAEWSFFGLRSIGVGLRVYP